MQEFEFSVSSQLLLRDIGQIDSAPWYSIYFYAKGVTRIVLTPRLVLRIKCDNTFKVLRIVPDTCTKHSINVSPVVLGRLD